MTKIGNIFDTERKNKFPVKIGDLLHQVLPEPPPGVPDARYPFKQDPNFQHYLKTFVPTKDSYIVQMPGKKWTTKHKTISDLVIHHHLLGDYWLGAKGGWYPAYGIIDIDYSYVSNDEQVYKIKTALKLSDGNYSLHISPGHNRTHILFKPVYYGKPTTIKNFKNILKKIVEEKGIELYPQKYRKVRLPFGLNQQMYDEDTKQRINHTWKEQLYYFDKLEPLELSQYPRQLEIEMPSNKEHIRLQLTGEAQELYAQGLQEFHTRNASLMKLAFHFLRMNNNPNNVLFALKMWIREKHNGFSDSINKGHIKVVDAEIHRIVARCSEFLLLNRFLPDSVHNGEGVVCAEDLPIIKDLFPDHTNRRRMFNFIAYCRPRCHHDKIYIPRWTWAEIGGGTNNYIKFRNLLCEKKIITLDNSYLVDDYSKSIRLNLKLQEGAQIMNDGRAIQNYEKAAIKIYQKLPDFQEMTGASRRNFFYAKKNN